ncbi:MAG: TonB-dependent receptor [Pseudomonadota bacterium]|nr:TonB-dependent receptor [Pseudomonadota bacterium]
MLTLLLLAAQPAVEPEPEIVVTAARTEQDKAETAASVVVVDEERIQRLGQPLLDGVLRSTPSAAVATSGPPGSLTEVRIRGAEANHTLLLIDGIRANDPAAGNTPRFELLNADIASRLEVVRGPQSALWGSEAIGGVIAINGVAEATPGEQLVAEAGSNGFRRGAVSGGVRARNVSLAGAIGWQGAAGIDSFDGSGDRDGYRNLSARLRGIWKTAPGLELGLAAFSLNGRSEYDGTDLLTFRRADTLDSTRNRLAAGRVWARFDSLSPGLDVVVGTSLLASSNRNLLAADELNRTRGRRWTADAQLQYRFATGSIAHTAVVALDHDGERFEARDILFGGASNQNRKRSHSAVTAEWRSQLRSAVLDIAIRRDRFSRFKDATTLRASALVGVGRGWSLAASYGEGIAQPTFFDLNGFFPGNFVGNPSLKPESSRGVETSLRYRRKQVDAALTLFRQRLHDEIVDVFDPATFQSTTANRALVSRRSGVEAELGLKLGEQLSVSAHYSYLRASEPSGDLQLKEARRPRHSGSIALDGASGRLTYGASIAFTGARADTDFDQFPARPVRLAAYWLAGARVGYRLRPGLELFTRGSNLIDANYQDAFGYRTEGRAIYAGVRLSGV